MTRTIAVYIVILMLTLISTVYVFQTVISPNVDQRIAHENAILAGQMEPPYQYRLIEPISGHVLEKLLRLFNPDIRWRHKAAYAAISFTAFFLTFSFFYWYLGQYYSQNISLVGILLLQTLIPLSVTGFYMEGDFINMAFYAAGLYLIVKNRDAYLPLLIIVASLNREQSVFLVLLYALYLISKQDLSKKKILILISCVIGWGLILMTTHLYFGFKPSKYTIALHMAHNTNYKYLTSLIAPLWLAEVIPSIILCILAFPKSIRFFQLSFLSIIIYTVLFFLNGNLWELAKYLPAFLILIPMALQVITDTYIEKSDSQSDNSRTISVIVRQQMPES